MTLGRMKLFDDDEEENEDVSKIEIDEDYAKRFEHNKKREDLQRYKELRERGVIDESEDESTESEEEDDDDEGNAVANTKKDLDFFNALLLIKKQDPKLKQKDVKLFHSESDEESDRQGEEEEEQGGNKKKKKKAKSYLKDVTAKQLIEEGPEFDEEEGDAGEKKKRPKSYNEEQEELRKAFLEAAKEVEDDDEEGDGFLKERKKEDNDEEDADDGEFDQKLDEYFGRDGELDEKEMFLKEFFKNQMWRDKENKDKDVGVDGEEVEDLLREEELLERQEQYEINFRHEEVVDDRVMGYSRKMEGSVRKIENARKEQRKSKEERMRIAEMERKEELKHLKNLKKKEMKERMKKVMAIAGFKEDEDLPLNLKDLDDEFDPEEYDKMMKAAFDDNYYGDEDVDPEFGRDREDDDGEIHKPDFDKEDELLGLPKGWHVIESHDGFKAARERSLKHKLENGGGDDDEEEESEEGEDDEEVSEESKRKKKRKMSLVKRAKEEMLEKIYEMDYEDTIGDLKTRFKYAKVKPNRYGLKTKEIFILDDKELNQYVPVKKLAPYREKEFKVPDSQRYQQKLKIKELIKRQIEQKSGKKRSKGDEKALVEEPNGDMGKLSKRAKTRRRQSKPKLPHSRLIAYGKIPSKAKSKEKH